MTKPTKHELREAVTYTRKQFRIMRPKHKPQRHHRYHETVLWVAGETAKSRGITNVVKLTDFVVGERVYYFLPCSPVHGRMTNWYKPATIEKITRSRIVVRIDAWPERTRATTPSQIRKWNDVKA